MQYVTAIYYGVCACNGLTPIDVTTPLPEGVSVSWTSLCCHPAVLYLQRNPKAVDGSTCLSGRPMQGYFSFQMLQHSHNKEHRGVERNNTFVPLCDLRYKCVFLSHLALQ